MISDYTKMAPISGNDSEAVRQEKVVLRKLAEEEAGKIISEVLEKTLMSKTIWVEMRRIWIGESVLCIVFGKMLSG